MDYESFTNYKCCAYFPFHKQTVCCKEIEGTFLYLKENISCHFFYIASKYGIVFACPNLFLPESDGEMVDTILDTLR